MLDSIHKSEISDLISEHFTPARPITHSDHLFGREVVLEEAISALGSPGRHIFLYGDRGVGKTSLAQSIAFDLSAAQHYPINVSCSEETNFRSIVEDIIESANGPDIDQSSLNIIRKYTDSTLGRSGDSKNLESSKLRSINNAGRIIRSIAAKSKNKLIVVIDEFDKMPSNERKIFSYLVKHVSDNQIGAQFIFCGVGNSLDDFVQFHESAGRYVNSIPVERLGYSARQEIITDGFDAMGILINSNLLTRISQVSDGFPYFVHLIGERIVHQLYNSVHLKMAERNGDGKFEVSNDIFEAACQSAIQSCAPFLKIPYEEAVLMGNDEYEMVLWSVADGPTLTRRVGAIYDESYLHIYSQFEGMEPLTIERFRSRIARLKNSKNKILKSRKTGWYEFSENMFRGYVRLRATSDGIRLTPDHHTKSRLRINRK